jgi:hypothetical protein
MAEFCDEEYEQWQAAYKIWQQAWNKENSERVDVLFAAAQVGIDCKKVRSLACVLAVAILFRETLEFVLAAIETALARKASDAAEDAYKKCVAHPKRDQRVVTPLPIVVTTSDARRG